MKKLCFSVVAMLAMTSMALAAPKKTATVAKPAPTAVAVAPANSSDAAAKIDLTKMSNVLLSAKGLTYSSEITYAVLSQAPPGYAMKTSSGTVTVERPARLAITTSAAGTPLATLQTSGLNLLIYDAAAGKYAVTATTPDLKDVMNALAQTANTVFTSPGDSPESLREAIGFPLHFLNGETVITQPPLGTTLHYAVEAVTSGGKKVNKVSETLQAPGRGSLKLTFLIDPATNLPLSQTVVSTPPNQPPVTISDEVFTGLKVLTTPAVAATYAFSPPATATLVVAPPTPTSAPPGAAPPGMAPAAPPTAPTTPAAPSPTAPPL